MKVNNEAKLHTLGNQYTQNMVYTIPETSHVESAMPERNALCHCGSGKKYKRCCGLSAARTPDSFAVNRAIAYKGTMGRRRQAFCEAYSSAKEMGLAGIEEQLRREVEEAGKTITCHKGCGYCCSVYVFANLQECENIVHYLYEHDDILTYYLQQYPRWKSNIDRLGAILPRIDDAQEKVLFGTATEDDRRVFNENLTAYAALRNPCPFLCDDACTIYEVRPYVCAGVISVNPSAYCMPEHPAFEENVLIKANFLPQNDMPYFTPTKNAINFGCMPALVQQILQYGYIFLSTIDGLGDMHLTAANDPEVRLTLTQLGVRMIGSIPKT